MIETLVYILLAIGNDNVAGYIKRLDEKLAKIVG